ncbi:MAG: hypothetical protein HY741_13055 [Chloroflexi bacterium]|nr:hypothetical protein [Chloroflexota bacterium]
MVRAASVLFLLLVACATRPAPTPVSPAQPATSQSSVLSPLNSLRAGWAYEAYPDATFEKMRADFQRMRDAGANAVWIGHNNPGEVDAQKVEPGLSYAVYAALQNENDALYHDAQQMSGAVKRALDAARETKLQVILPIGYQIQMGDAWNQQHPDALRLTFDGSRLDFYNSGYTASPYSEQYRADIMRYYEWIQREWVAPYRDVIVMLSLADEPMGGDYSDAAKLEFAERYGKAMDELAPEEAWKLGEFQAGVIADYAAWSAHAWQQINPNILTTMSFHGGDTARRVWGLPEVEKLFTQTPDNFIVSFDAYLHDDLATKPATADEAAQLKLFLTTLGHYSKVYQKPIALWSGANAWGLAQESSAPRSIPDAVTNLLLLYDLPARVGGTMWGVFAWNYNVKQQGLENYARPTTYDPRALEIAVNRALPLLRARPTETAPAAPDIAIVVSARVMYNALAASHTSDVPPDWFDAAPYARAFADRAAVIVSSAKTLAAANDARFLIVTAPGSDLDAATLNFLREQFTAGKIILGDETLARALDARSQTWRAGLTQLPTAGGVVYLFAEE